MAKLIFKCDDISKIFRWVWRYNSQEEAQKDANLMNAVSSMFFYRTYKGKFYWHVLSVDSETGEPFSLL